MSTSEPKTYTWPWLITAWSFPLIIAGAIIVGVVRANRADLELQMKEASATATNKRHTERKEELRKWGERIHNLVGFSAGFSPTDVKQVNESLASIVPNEDQTPIQKNWENFVNNTVNPEVASLQGLRNHFLDYAKQLEGAVAMQMAYSYRIYGDESFLDINDKMSEADLMASLQRVSDLPTSNPTPEILSAAQKASAPPLNMFTMSDALSARDDIVKLLNHELQDQYNEAMSYSAWKNTGNNTFKRIDESMKDDFERAVANAKTASNTWTDKVVSDTTSVKKGYTGTQDQYDTMGSNLDGQSTTIVGAIGAMERDLNESIDTIKKDADSFRTLMGQIKLIGGQSVIAKTMASDGELSHVDNAGRTCHINLGSDKNIVPGMRFEVHKIGGMAADHFKGVIEVVRTIGRHYSLCTILELVNDAEPLAAGDTIINRLWDADSGRYLNIALHGKEWKVREEGLPGTLYDKFELAEMLKAIGVKVQDRATPSTDIVILGIGTGDGDDHYQEMSKAVRFEVLRELQIRLYVQPR